ncbi:MAG: beta-galactosidase [Chloroflexota bacterium]|nr:beta-galactosidase [Chloroflexota bacterium]
MSVRLNGRHLEIDGRPRFLQSAEIQYFRLPREAWEDRVRRAAEGGMNTAGVYIPWIWHEPEEGRFDFTGQTRPERDLVGFLDLLRHYGLFAIVRPGPFINAEFNYGGHPMWLFERYPEVYSHRADGGRAFWEGHGVPVPSQLHPTFSRLVDAWYDQVIPILAERTHERGGPVILAQPDNEMNLMFTYGVHGSLYDQYVVGDESRHGLWQTWLNETYGSLEAVNRRYGTHAADWAAIRPPTGQPRAPAHDLRTLDWLRFKREFVFRYARRLMARMRALGLHVPLFMNEPMNRTWVWSPGQHAAAYESMRNNEVKDFFTAGHCYLYGGEQDFQGIGGAINHTAMVKSSGAPGPAVVIETAAAWWEIISDRVGERAPYNWDILMRVQLGCGIDGYNYYIYAGGRTPQDVGNARGGLWYDWAVPIGYDGSLRPAYAKTRELAEFIRGWEPEILATRQSTDLVIGLFDDLPLLAKETDGAVELGTLNGSQRVAELAQDVYANTGELVTVLASLGASIEIEILDYAVGRPLRPETPLVVLNPGRLPRAGVDRILAHLGAGGRAVLLPAVPSATVDGEPDSRLLDLLQAELDSVVPIRGASALDFRYKSVAGRTVNDAAVDRAIFLYRPRQGGQLEVLASYNGQPCAFRQPAAGGELIVCGVLPRYITEDSLALFRDILLDATGANRAVTSEGEQLYVVQRETDGNPEGPRLIVAANVRGSEVATRLHVRLADGELVFPGSEPLEVLPKRTRALWVNLPLAGACLRYCTSEIAPADAERTSFVLRGEVGTRGEIAFDRRLQVTLDGQDIPLERRDGAWVGTYPHTREGRRLVLGNPG